MAESQVMQLEAPICRAVVFRDGARVIRSGRLELTEGIHTISVVGLTRSLREDSVRVTGSGKGRLGAIDVRRQYSDHAQSQELDRLEQERRTVEKQLETLREDLSFLARQAESLKVMSDRIAGEFPGWYASGDTPLDNLSAYLAFEAGQHKENSTAQRDLRNQIEEGERRLETIEARLDELPGLAHPESTVEVGITVEAVAEGPFTIELSYQADGVQWAPTYDVDLGEKTAAVRGFAQITNMTLEDWTDVELEVSTAVFRPVRIDDPAPFYVDIERPIPQDLIAAAPMASLADEEMEPAKKSRKRAAIEMEEPPMEEPEAELQESNSGVQSFNLPGTWTVPSDGNPHPVNLTTFELPTQKRFYWSASESAAVIAVDRLINGEGVLLPGKSRVYSEGDYVGETVIDRIAPREEFELGAREELQMKAEKKLVTRSREKAGLMKGRRSVDYQYELVLNNYRKEASQITVKDVVPYSRTEQIKVKWNDGSPAPTENRLGVYTWELELDSGAEQRITYRYSVDIERDVAVYPPLP